MSSEDFTSVMSINFSYLELPGLTTNLTSDELPMVLNNQRRQNTIFCLRISSCVMTFVSIILWLLTWIKGRKGSPFRYAPLLLLFSSTLIFQVLEVTHEDEYDYDRDDISLMSRLFFFNLMEDINVCSLLGYMALCLLRLMKRAATNIEVAACLFVCIVPAVLYEGLITFLKVGTDLFEKVYYSYSDAQKFYGVTRTLPYTIGLMLAILATLALALKSFFHGGPVSRDHKYIRVSSLGLVIIVLNRCAEHLILTFSWFEVVRVWSWVSFLLAIRGILYSVFLCYLDLEVWSLLPCVDVKDEHHAEYIIGREADDTRSTKPLREGQVPLYGTGQILEKENAPQSSQTTSFEGATNEAFPEKQ